MRLICFTSSSEDTAVQELPEPDLVVDPRPIVTGASYKFEVTVNGTALTITRIDPPVYLHQENLFGRQTGWYNKVRFRVYNSNEERYSFDSTKYLFHGLKYEHPPHEAKEVFVKDGMETIKISAFIYCKSVMKITIPESVKAIENLAFDCCKSLRFVQLPPNLQYIGRFAFARCTSLEAVFLPPTVTHIGNEAFSNCTSLRILYIPDSVEHNFGSEIIDIHNSRSLTSDEMAEATYDNQIEWLRNRYNPLHNLCCQPSPSPQAITQYIQDNNDNDERARTKDRPQFTALHLLVANPSVTGDMIAAYLQLAPDVATVRDNFGMTPLHMLCSRLYFSNGTRDAIRAHLAYEEGKVAAFMIDVKGKTPLDYICEKDSNELAPFVGGTFSNIMVWWYACLDMNLLVE